MIQNILLPITAPALIATPQAGAGGPDMTRYLMVCALLLGLIGGLAWLFKRFVATAVKSRAAKRSLQILDVLPLGGKQRMCVVRCYDRTFALGLGDKEVALIAELDPVTGAEPVSVPFGEALRREQERPDVESGVGTPRKKRSLFPTGGLFG